jgi:transcriptional regulator with PAS, ATPase and Fis domain
MRGVPYREAVRDRSVEQTIRKHGGNKTYAAKALGIKRASLYRLVHALNAKVPSQAPRRPSPVR